MSVITTQHIYTGSHSRKALYDVSINPNNCTGKLILFLHGFKSFKDWGAWPWLAHQLASGGHCVVKINFSHNGVGTDLKSAEEFTKLDAFAQNNFSIEIKDVFLLIDELAHNDTIPKKLLHNICCIGHSMGGGIALLAAAKHPQITDVIALNPVSDFKNLLQHFNLTDWKNDDVVYVANARTNQQMPLNFQLYVDYQNNKNELDIIAASANLKRGLIIYAANDETVSPNHSQRIIASNNKLISELIENAGHTFGASHPFLEPNEHLLRIVQLCLQHLVNQP
jgi:uncharacterized protein